MTRGATVALLGALACSPPAYAGCEALLPDVPKVTAPRRLSTDDLLTLGDFGRLAGSAADESPFSLSPNGRLLAFVLRRASPQDNVICQGVVVLDLATRRPRLIDRGGDLIRYRFDDLRGLVFPTGTEAIVVPRWSPDGSRLAYLRKTGAHVAIRVVAADGSAARSIQLRDDVEAVDWTGRTTLVVQTRPALPRAEEAIAREGETGFLYDDRFVPMAASRPFVRGPTMVDVRLYDLASGAQRNADAAARTILDPSANLDRPKQANLFARAPGGARAWTESRTPGRYKAPVDLWVRLATGDRIGCAAEACTSLEALWWQGGTLILQRREGWARSLTALYRWTPGKGVPQRILQTPDLLLGCQIVRTVLVCGREASTQPRRVVAIDLRSGRETILFDPNPGFAALTLGPAERLHWRNARGVESFGDLVLPADHRPGQRHPLIVVQYRTRGFLRGGTGDEFPIQAFAARGYAVLSIERPPFLADERPDPKWRSWLDAEPANLAGWVDRRNVLSTLLGSIDLVVARGVADPTRIGLTGMSDGSTTAQFALVNTHRFAAAALSSCCEDPRTELVVAGQAMATEFMARGYPPPLQDAPGFWRPFSIALNARQVTTPILMQLSDDEYMMGLEAYTALRQQNRPTEMYVFPGEHHAKWQPRHRAAIYARNLDWFDFWLLDRVDPDPAKAAQYARWRALRTAAPQAETLQPGR